VSAQVAADLRAAAGVLRRDGWTRFTALSDDGCRCATGAIAFATSDGATSRPGRVPDDGHWDRWTAACDALRAQIGDDGIADWNDTSDRTADEVIAALEAAADAAERAS